MRPSADLWLRLYRKKECGEREVVLELCLYSGAQSTDQRRERDQ
jgi:hypothetical protein